MSQQKIFVNPGKSMEPIWFSYLEPLMMMELVEQITHMTQITSLFTELKTLESMDKEDARKLK